MNNPERTIQNKIYLVRNVKTGDDRLTDRPGAGNLILATYTATGLLFEGREEWTLLRDFGGDYTVEDLVGDFRKHLNAPSDGVETSASEVADETNFDSHKDYYDYWKPHLVATITLFKETGQQLWQS